MEYVFCDYCIHSASGIDENEVLHDKNYLKMIQIDKFDDFVANEIKSMGNNMLQKEMVMFGKIVILEKDGDDFKFSGGIYGTNREKIDLKNKTSTRNCIASKKYIDILLEIRKAVQDYKNRKNTEQ